MLRSIVRNTSARRLRGADLLAVAVLASLLVASGCIATRFTEERGLTSLHFDDSHGAAYIWDLVEVVWQPLLLVYDLLRLRFIWDHRVFALSGLVNTLLHIPAILPGYSHVDSTCPRPF